MNAQHPMVQAYLVAALWTSNDEENEQGGNPLDENYTIADIAPDSIQQAIEDCSKFFLENMDDLNCNLEQVGHDFWLTRNHHGAGFWDGDWGKERGDRLTKSSHSYKELSPMVGDDNLIHFEG